MRARDFDCAIEKRLRIVAAPTRRVAAGPHRDNPGVDVTAGTLDLGPDGGFASLITFTGGTGRMAGASGQIRLRGPLDQEEGTTSGDYIGTLCTP